MVTAEELEARRRAILASRDLQLLRTHLESRAAPLLERMPVIPAAKALLSMDGGVCPHDGTTLTFDPWSPTEHRCPACGQVTRGERHDRWWAKYQHLWLGERAAHLATLRALSGHEAAGARAAEILRAYAGRYWTYPNRDNVLGPSRLFFSTYLESLWILNYLSAAMLLREAGALDEATTKGVYQVADEAVSLIGDYHEGFSNRQTWNNAALAAIAVWFEDEDLARTAIEGQGGLLDHLRGFRSDGMWYEGENYHLFALRGLLTGAGWARLAGVDLMGDADLAPRVLAALRAPSLTALPDFTFPARKDSRFGVSLAQPMYLELWEVGLGRMGRGEEGRGTGALSTWLTDLYRVPPVKPELFESYLHAVPIDSVPRPPSRVELSWWSLLEMLPELPSGEAAPNRTSVFMPSQGLGVLRNGDSPRYVSLECGPYGGGHGHPDRLHLTLHADGVHWLRDVGTGSYVARDLFWYRSTLAHNAPRLDGVSQAQVDATCEAYETQSDWSWVRGRWESCTRTVVSGPTYVVDVVELAGSEEHLVELPWHVGGRGDVESPGRWESGALEDEFVTRVERFVPDQPGPIVIEHAARGARLRAHLVFEGELLRAEAPGEPGAGTREVFYLARGRGRNLRLTTVLEPTTGESLVRAVSVKGELIEVDTNRGLERHRDLGKTWEVELPQAGVRLAGAREAEQPFQPLLTLERPQPVRGFALRVDAQPPLDGTLDGFDTSEPLGLDLEDQYRRSEEPYPGPDEFSAVAHVAWDDAALYVGVDVTKPEPWFRPLDAPPLRLDNEPDDIHSDGLQVYVQEEGRRGKGEAYAGYLVVPQAGGTLRARPVDGTGGSAADVAGGWRRTDHGYRVTLAVRWPAGRRPHVGAVLGFDLIINEMLADGGRQRRAGQLVWSGGNGWVWLQGDRQDPDRFGILELVG